MPSATIAMATARTRDINGRHAFGVSAVAASDGQIVASGCRLSRRPSMALRICSSVACMKQMVTPSASYCFRMTASGQELPSHACPFSGASIPANRTFR